MSTRLSGFSPYKYAFDGLLAVVASSRQSASEGVKLHEDSKKQIHPEVTAVCREGESLMACYARAAEVMREALTAFGNGAPDATPFD